MVCTLGVCIRRILNHYEFSINLSMSEEHIINSKEYWDRRFATDWKENGGAEQSRFFAKLATEFIPEWLRQAVRRDALHVCDWGCAHGDGTDYVMQTLGWDMTGVDFSDMAIQEARRRYPAIDFRCENWLDQTPRSKFDVVFSSNTLEHFPDPWMVFEKISRFASKFVVLLLPYKERLPHPGHAATFDSHGILMAPGEQYFLVQSTVIDASDRDPSYWPGLQILLVYARHEEISRYRISLADASFATDVIPQTLAVAQSQEDVRRETGLRDEPRVLAVQKDAFLAAPGGENAQLQSLRLQIDTLKATLSWRWTRPLRSVRGVQLRVGDRLAGVKRAYRSGGIPHVFSRAATALRGRSSAPALPASIAAMLPVPSELADVYIFAVIDWSFRIQRPQHLARALAQRGHRVFYLTNHFCDAEQPGYVIETLDAKLPIYQVRLHVRGAPSIYFGAPSPEAAQQIDAGICLLEAQVGFHAAVCLVQHAYWAWSAATMQSDSVVYDCMDDHEGFGNVPAELIALESWIMRRADLVVTTSSLLEQRARQANPQVAMVRNAAQHQDFCARPATVYADPRGRRVIGYYGAIAEWFDIDLVRQIALAFPDHLVLLVGADTVGAQRKLRNQDNVVFTGEVPYTELPFYVYAFDVCLLPFKVMPLTRATNPVKVYEYLSAGRAVVSIDLPELSQFAGLVRTAKDHPGFIREVRQALAEDVNDAVVFEHRQEFAAGQTWEHRARQLEVAIAQVPRPRVSVVVLTYNNLSLTRDCLKSLEACRSGVDMEIIVVDNASTDDTRQFLGDWSAVRDHVRVILNAQNAGFAAGNNIGLAAATGDYMVILNNDTVVTPGWAWRLVNHLRNNPEIGLVGPITNNIGNEARVSASYTTLDEMLVEAERLTRPKRGRYFEIQTLAFFCVMLSRSVYEVCGPLCEDYGLGMFEDDDYCRRVQAVGLRTVCAEDVFVHHRRSASFDKLGQEHKKALFEKNRAIYEAKWGAWIPHVYRDQSVLHRRVAQGVAGLRRLLDTGRN